MTLGSKALLDKAGQRSLVFDYQNAHFCPHDMRRTGRIGADKPLLTGPLPGS